MIAVAAALLVLMYSIVLHEVSHGVAARMFGDPTAQKMGRLTLNPVPHADLVGTVLLPLALFLAHAPFLIGWAKPVPYNPLYFRHRRAGTIVVAAAGPLANFLLAFVFAALLRGVGGKGPFETVLFYGLSLNVMLGLFNLIPVPPLDGSKAVAMLLPAPLRAIYLRNERLGMVLILVLMATGLFGTMLTPLYRWTMTRYLGA